MSARFPAPASAVRVLVSAISVLVLHACDSDCKSPEDCEQGFVCSSGKCVERTPPPPPGPRPDAQPVDATPDSGHPDAGGLDATAPDAADAAAPSDAGVVDRDAQVADLAAADTGATGADAGPAGDVGPTSAWGEVWIAEFRAAPSNTHEAFAKFFDDSPATFTEQRSEYMAAAGEGTCLLTVRRLASGTPRGLEAREVLIQPGQNPFLSEITLSPAMGMPGVYTTTEILPPDLFVGVNMMNVSFDLRSTNAPGSLAAASVITPKPERLMVSSPAPGAMVLATAPIVISWTPQTPQTPALEPRVDLTDAAKEVVLRCTTPDDGMFTIPDEARTAWLGANPGAMRKLRIHYSKEASATVPILGPMPMPAAVPVVFRASYGAEWTIP